MTDTIHIVLAMKPIEGNFSQNAIEHEVAGLNIDGCRVGTDDSLGGGAYADSGGRMDLPGASRTDTAAGMMAAGKTTGREFVQPLGRFPANVIHDGSEEVVDGFPSNNPSCKKPSLATPKSKYRPNQGNYQPQGVIYPNDNGTSASRFFKECKPDD